MQTRLCYVFKTTNDVTLNETILKNNYRVLQRSWKKNELKADSEILKDRIILGSF